MAEGGGRPRWGVVILSSEAALTRSELTGESIFGLGDRRDFASGMRGEKSWVKRPPNSVLDGCEMVSNMDIEGEPWQHVRGTGREHEGVRCEGSVVGSRTARSSYIL